MEENNEHCLTLNLSNNFDEQVVEILQNIRMSKTKVEELKILYDDLQQLFPAIFEGEQIRSNNNATAILLEQRLLTKSELAKTYGSCEVKPFGSIVMDVALESSDGDYFIDKCGASPRECIRRTLEFVRENPTPFENVIPIIDTKVPIVRFTHSITGFECDISFSGPLAVDVGNLVSHLLHMDPRALQLAILIKYWAKINKLTGKKLLPTYALLILVIFFLQYKRILPSVATLQKQVAPSMTVGWNTAFAKIKIPSANIDTLFLLMGEFFTFYSNYNFADLVVSPYLGSSEKRLNITQTIKLRPEFQLYKTNVSNGLCREIPFRKFPMCVQCVFDLSRNVTIAVRPPLAHRILECFKAAADTHNASSEARFLERLLHIKRSYMAEHATHSQRAPQGHGNRPRLHLSRGQANRVRGQAHRARQLALRRGTRTRTTGNQGHIQRHRRRMRRPRDLMTRVWEGDNVNRYNF